MSKGLLDGLPTYVFSKAELDDAIQRGAISFHEKSGDGSISGYHFEGKTFVTEIKPILEHMQEKCPRKTETRGES